jgi:hypothetical protein
VGKCNKPQLSSAFFGMFPKLGDVICYVTIDLLSFLPIATSYNIYIVGPVQYSVRVGQKGQVVPLTPHTSFCCLGDSIIVYCIRIHIVQIYFRLVVELIILYATVPTRAQVDWN